MLSTQFLASCLRQSHPSNDVVSSLPGPRSMKSTLQSKFISSILPHLIDGAIDPSNYRTVLKQIHNQAVSNTISSLNANLLLGTIPPPISPSEKRLTRIQRTTLAQLRSGHCKLLGDYKVLTGLGTSAICHECLFRRQTVPHLFNCDAAPTQLTVRDLWVNPVTIMEHLVSLSHLSPLWCLLTRLSPRLRRSRLLKVFRMSCLQANGIRGHNNEFGAFRVFLVMSDHFFPKLAH